MKLKRVFLFKSFLFKPSLMINEKKKSSISRKHRVFGKVPSTLYLNFQRDKTTQADICFEKGNKNEAVQTFTMQLK